MRRLPLTALLVAAGCGPSGPAVEVTNPRAPAPPVDVMSVYLTLYNRGRSPDTLIGVTTDIGGEFTVHETVKQGVLMEMVPVTELVVPAGDSLVWSPGLMHGMVRAFTSPVAQGDTVTVTLTFSGSGDVVVRVPVVSYLDVAP